MKILFIYPYWKTERQPIIPPMGIMSLAAYLRERMDPAPEIKFIDQRAGSLSVERVAGDVVEFGPDIVGFSAMTFEAPAVHALAGQIKNRLPEALIIMGGPHATVFYDHLLNRSDVEIAVIGEGEETLLEIASRVRNGADWRDVNGIAFTGDDGDIIRTGKREHISDLDSLPLPAWDLVDIPRYSSVWFGDMNGFLAARPYMPVFTSRACPYGCIYCHSVFGKKFRARSPQSAVDEIKKLSLEHGVKEIHIFDDIFNWDIDRAKDICRGIIDEGIKVKIAFPNGIRGDLLDGELIELLAKAGCYSMTFAVETASKRLQKKLRKFADLDKIEWAMDKARREGIIPMGFFMLGFPTETEEELEATIEFAVRSKMLKAFFFSVVPFPRTRLFDLFKQTYPGQFNIEEDDLENMYYYTRQSFYSRVTGIDLARKVRNAYRRFYLKPGRILGIFAMFPWNITFFRGVFYGLRSVGSAIPFLESILIRKSRKKMGMEELSPP